jgi:UTP-glucose-1-phosphate uridylyltransferase
MPENVKKAIFPAAGLGHDFCPAKASQGDAADCDKR